MQDHKTIVLVIACIGVIGIAATIAIPILQWCGMEPNDAIPQIALAALTGLTGILASTRVGRQGDRSGNGSSQTTVTTTEPTSTVVTQPEGASVEGKTT